MITSVQELNIHKTK